MEPGTPDRPATAGAVIRMPQGPGTHPGTPVPVRDRGVGASSRTYGFSVNVQVVVDADTRLVVTAPAPWRGRRPTPTRGASGVPATCTGTTVVADGRPVLLVLVTVMIALLYWAAPNAKGRGFKWVTPGSFLALVIWMIASTGFAFYVANFGSYNKTYGTLAGVIIFLVWLWITNLAVLLALEFDAEMVRRRAIAGGHPADEEPYTEPRDTREWSEEDRHRLD
ncbi:hypothetical protein GCM10009639_54810 [Kitasatospora putterlickiae]|uniref:Uncharacterized protein n=1 Tax=Kitasatospora putterlickiae TaxID=221725 RepID=A0ABN1YFH3_9ACTN